MKTVFLLRHAKSKQGSAYATDFERPLAKRGKQDAEKVGAWMAKLDLVPDLVISSPAKRAKQTIQRCIEAADYQGEFTTFNLGSGQGASLSELILMMEEVTGKVPEVEYKEGRAFDIPRIVLDIDRAERELAWRPVTSLREGIRLTWQAIAHESDQV